MKFYNKKDIVIVGVLIFASLFAYYLYKTSNEDKKAIAKIFYQSELVKTIELEHHKDEIFSIEENKHVKFQTYSDGSIAFIESDCPDKVCIHAGKLHLAGQSAACLPNHIILKIEPIEEFSGDDMDIIIR